MGIAPILGGAKLTFRPAPAALGTATVLPASREKGVDPHATRARPLGPPRDDPDASFSAGTGAAARSASVRAHGRRSSAGATGRAMAEGHAGRALRAGARLRDRV